MGVRRAVDMAAAASRQAESSGGRVYSLGPLIHNPRVLEELERLGLRITDGLLPHKLNGAVVVIRAHGVSPETEAALRDAGACLIDATCPRVKASQLKAASFARCGRRIFLAGEASHAEIAGIIGYAAAGFYAVAGSVAEAETLAASLYSENPDAKTALLGQTTITEGEYNAVAEAVKKYFPDIEIALTICPATSEQQKSLRELAEIVDAIVIAGGKESANARRLLSVAQESRKPCVLVETAADIPQNFYRYETIGLAAGTSAPDSVMQEIEQALNGE